MALRVRDRVTGAWLFSLPVLSVMAFGCGGGGGRVEPARPVDQLVAARQPAAPPRLLAGGDGAHAALLCGASMHRLTVGPAAVDLTGGAARDAATAWFGADAAADCYLGMGPEGPALARGGQAWRLPGWPAGAGLSAAAFSPDGRLLAAAPSGSTGSSALRVYPVPPARPLVLNSTGSGVVEHLAWDATGKYLLATRDDGEVTIYQLPKSKPVYRQRLDPAVEGRITAADLSPDGDWFVVAASSIRLRTWRLPFLSAPLQAWGEVRQVFFVDGNAAVITIDETDSAIRWLVNYGKVKSDRTANLGTLRATAVSADGSTFFTFDTSGHLKAWRGADLQSVEAADTTICRE